MAARSLPPLRWYQERVLELGRQHVAEGRTRILVQLATGLGKTRTAVEACVRHVALGGLPLCVAPRRELVAQLTSALVAGGLEPGQNVVVATIQELTAKGAVVPAASLVVLDEARHYVADTWGRLVAVLPDAIFLGLDATPERGDGLGLGDLFEVIVEAISIADAIAQDFLVPFEVLRPDRALGPGELAQDVVDVYCAKAEGTSGIVFSRSVTDAQDQADRFRARGVSAAAVWGEMPLVERDAALSAYARRETLVLTNAQLLTEGFDAPLTETIILARGFLTAGAMIQATGRGARPYPGKKRCLVLDLVGCTHLHGEPGEPRTWHLEGRAARRTGDDVAIRFCPLCGSPVPGEKCESCGYEGAEMRKRKPRILGLAVDRFARQRQETDEQKAKRFAFYLAEARRLRRNPYSAHHRFRGVYGHLPTPEITRLARSLG